MPFPHLANLYLLIVIGDSSVAMVANDPILNSSLKLKKLSIALLHLRKLTSAVFLQYTGNLAIGYVTSVTADVNILNYLTASGIKVLPPLIWTPLRLIAPVYKSCIAAAARYPYFLRAC